VVVPAGACLMSAAPSGPVQVMVDGLPGAGGEVEQAFDLDDGQRDQPGLGWWWLGRAGRGAGCFSVSVGVGAGDRADGESGHDEDEVPRDRGVRAGLELVVAELVLGERPLPDRGDIPRHVGCW